MFAFTHLIAAWILGKIYESWTKKKVSYYTWFFLLFGALLPDADFILDWTLGTELHRTFTHSLLFLFSAPLLLYIVLYLVNDKGKNKFALGLFGGIASHFVMDMIIPLGIPLFWPNLLHFSSAGVVYFDPATPSFLHSSLKSMRFTLKTAVFDMGLGTMWIFWLWFRRRIKF
jgi:membrane-bound metal-dependent hydrolase YbcI (DUF457 family)